MPELPGAGPGAPVHAAAEDEAGAESRTEVQVGEGATGARARATTRAAARATTRAAGRTTALSATAFAATGTDETTVATTNTAPLTATVATTRTAPLTAGRETDREAQRRRVGVLVDDDRHAEPPRQRVPQREPVPLREARDPVQHAPDVVERARKGDAQAEEGGRGGEGPSRRVQRVGDQLPGHLRHRLHHVRRARAQVQRGAPLPRHGTVEVHQHRTQLVPVQVDAERVARLRHQAQYRARLAARGRPASGLGGEAVLPEPGGDLADRLRGEPGPLGELQPADALRTGGAQQVEHQGGVVAAQGEQVGAPRREAHTRTRTPTRTRTAAVRAVPADPVVRPVHASIVPGACTLATALRK